MYSADSFDCLKCISVAFLVCFSVAFLLLLLAGLQSFIAQMHRLLLTKY